MHDPAPRYLAIDSRIIVRSEEVTTKLGQIEKSPMNPLFVEDYFAKPPRSWEARYDNFYPNVVYTPEARGEAERFRLWYNVFTHDSLSERTPLSARWNARYEGKIRRTDGLLLAVSSDGITWFKPELGIVEHDGATANNIVMSTGTHGLHGAGVLYDPDDPDPSRRYKALFRNSTDRVMAVAFSSDGLRWAPPVNWPEHDAVGDTHNNAIRMPDGTYVGITRGWVGPKDRRVRVVMRTQSRDFVHWSEPVEILRGANQHDQIYSMPIFRVGPTYLGLPATFHKGDPSAPDWDTVDTEFAWSPDTVAWRRVCPGTPLIPRGAGAYPTGAYDCGCVYAGAPVLVGSTHRIYYGASNGLHNGFREGSFCLATVPRDRFAGLHATARPGLCSTAPFVLDGPSIALNLEVAEGGLVRAELRGSDDQPVEGFTLDDCVPIRNSSLAAIPEWQSSGSLSSLSGRRLVLHIQLSKATLFAVSGDLRFALKEQDGIHSIPALGT